MKHPMNKLDAPLATRLRRLLLLPLIGAAALALNGCGSLSAPARPVVYDFGPGATTLMPSNRMARQPTITPVETAHHSAIPGHLAQIAMVTGRKIRWDNATETILNDPEASKLLTREYRGPWKMS